MSGRSGGFLFIFSRLLFERGKTPKQETSAGSISQAVGLIVHIHSKVCLEQQHVYIKYTPGHTK